MAQFWANLYINCVNKLLVGLHSTKVDLAALQVQLYSASSTSSACNVHTRIATHQMKKSIEYLSLKL